VAALVVAAAMLIRPDGRTASGAARVVDGDSLRLAGEDIRLVDIDAPELAQDCQRGGRPWRCGEAAREALAARIGSRPVACAISGRDRYGRALATCAVEGVDLGAFLVAGGFAVASGAYDAEERAARASRAGLWGGTFEHPSAWRQRQEAR
jgi:endonuclease YncB( thermonuclease family)